MTRITPVNEKGTTSGMSSKNALHLMTCDHLSISNGCM